MHRQLSSHWTTMYNHLNAQVWATSRRLRVMGDRRAVEHRLVPLPMGSAVGGIRAGPDSNSGCSVGQESKLFLR